MAATSSKPVFDGATLSPKLKPKADQDAVSLPIGKTGGGLDRAYKHAAGKSNTYAPEVVDMIYHMSRQGVFDDGQVSAFVEAKLMAERDLARQIPAATWDQLVFLSANLTRLVIDPYREKCDSRAVIGPGRPRPLFLAWPIVFGQVDFARLPEALPGHIARAAAQGDLAITVAADLPRDSTWTASTIIEVDAGSEPVDLATAAAVQITPGPGGWVDAGQTQRTIEAVHRSTDAQIPVGVVVPVERVGAIVDATVGLGIDFYVCDGQWTGSDRPTEIFPELGAAPRLEVLTETVERLRRHCQEEHIQVIYRGGIRGGADAGKAHCLGATAVTLGLAAVIGMGFKITRIDNEKSLIESLAKSRDSDEVQSMVYNFAKSIVTEVTMLARACGKSSVANMEPEDLRALTIDTSAATGIPLAGRDACFRERADLNVDDPGVPPVAAGHE